MPDGTATTITDSTLQKIAELASTLEPDERAALNSIMELAKLGADVAAQEITRRNEAGDENEGDVEGFMIISGGRSGPGSGGGSGGGGGSSPFIIPAPPPPAGPGGIPTPYVNLSSALGGRFPF